MTSMGLAVAPPAAAPAAAPAADRTRRLTLRDGRVIGIRRVRSADADRLRELDDGLSDRSRQLRYLGWMPPMAPEQARTLASVDFRDHFAMVATASGDDGERIVADCRLAPCEGPGRVSEIGIGVAEDFQGAGLGRELIATLLAVAAEQGITSVVAEVRHDNDRMRHLLPALGFHRTGQELDVVVYAARPSILGGWRAPRTTTTRWR